MNREQLVSTIVEAVLATMPDETVPSSQVADSAREFAVTINVSNRHLHLSETDLEILFGSGWQLGKMKDLMQPGQYACQEVVTLVGPRGVRERVRVLGPIRKQTQVEISRSDAIALGVDPPVRDSGDLAGSAGITLVGPKGSVTITEGLILASRHIHVPRKFADKWGKLLVDGQRVMVATEKKQRKLIFDDVLIRISDKFALEMHLDIDEANAALINNGDPGRVLLDR